MKFIVSSANLYKLLCSLSLDELDREEEIIMKLEGGNLTFQDLPSYPISIEQKENFEWQTNVIQLNGLRTFLRSISEQPIVLVLGNDGRFIKVSEILI